MFGKIKQSEEYRSSLKSMDTEEWFDLHFYRPLGYGWALLARRLGISPNAITVASIFLGVGAGVCFYFNSLAINTIGVFLLVWADSFDSADGQLARITGKYSRIGRILDGLSGDLWFAAIYIAICFRENATSPFFMDHQWVIWTVAVVAGACHGLQAAQADYYRQFHLFFVKGKNGSELENTGDLRERFRSLSWRRNFVDKVVLGCYLQYSIGQENRTPWMGRFRSLLRERYGDSIPERMRDEFRKESLPLMKYTNMLSFNVRTWALFAALLIFRMPWLYFAFELVVLNAMLIYMMVRHERICRSFVDKLETGKY